MCQVKCKLGWGMYAVCQAKHKLSWGIVSGKTQIELGKCVRQNANWVGECVGQNAN